MVEEQQPADEQARSEQGAAGAGEGNGAQAGDRQREESGPSHGALDWPDLQSYCDQLRAEHEAWVERLTAVQTHFAHLRPALLGIAAQYRALAIEDDLEQVNQLVLGGAAMSQMLRLGYDLERYISLFWPVAGDPRPSHARPESDGEYRVDVYLHVGPDGRGRIRVEGEKRLEAPLPTTRERLRSVLLRAVQAPKFVATPGTASGENVASAGAEEARGTASEGPRAEAEERTEVGTEQPVPEAEPRPGDPHEQPPPEEQVIPLGPAETPKEDPPKRRRRKS